MEQIATDNNCALRFTAGNGHQEIVKYLEPINKKSYCCIIL